METLEIPEKFIENIWTEIESLQSKTKAEALTKDFISKQGSLAKYILMATDELDESAHELGFFISIVIWSSYDKFFAGKLNQIDSDFIEATHEKLMTEIGELENVNTRFIQQRILNKSDYSQQFILKYIATALFEQNENEAPLTDEEIAVLFIVLSVHMKCLDAAVTKD